MSNFDSLFKNASLPQVKRYQTAIKTIRKNARTKSQKIDAIRNQINYMSLMSNAGHHHGGVDGLGGFNPENNDAFDFFKKSDVDYIFNALNVPYSKTKSSILGNVKDVYKVIKYMDFVKSLDTEQPGPDFIGPRKEVYTHADVSDKEYDYDSGDSGGDNPFFGKRSKGGKGGKGDNDSPFIGKGGKGTGDNKKSNVQLKNDKVNAAFQNNLIADIDQDGDDEQDDSQDDSHDEQNDIVTQKQDDDKNEFVAVEMENQNDNEVVSEIDYFSESSESESNQNENVNRPKSKVKAKPKAKSKPKSKPKPLKTFSRGKPKMLAFNSKRAQELMKNETGLAREYLREYGDAQNNILPDPTFKRSKIKKKKKKN